MYKIAIPKIIEFKVKNIIQEKSLPFSFGLLIKEIKKELNKLGENPSLGEKAKLGVFKDEMRYSFKIERLPLVFQFTVAYQFSSNEEEIIIVRISYTIGNPPEICI